MNRIGREEPDDPRPATTAPRSSAEPTGGARVRKYDPRAEPDDAQSVRPPPPAPEPARVIPAVVRAAIAERVVAPPPRAAEPTKRAPSRTSIPKADASAATITKAPQKMRKTSRRMKAVEMPPPLARAAPAPPVVPVVAPPPVVAAPVAAPAMGPPPATLNSKQTFGGALEGASTIEAREGPAPISSVGAPISTTAPFVEATPPSTATPGAATATASTAAGALVDGAEARTLKQEIDELAGALGKERDVRNLGLMRIGRGVEELGTRLAQARADAATVRAELTALKAEVAAEREARTEEMAERDSMFEKSLDALRQQVRALASAPTGGQIGVAPIVYEAPPPSAHADLDDEPPPVRKKKAKAKVEDAPMVAVDWEALIAALHATPAHGET